MLLMLFAPTKYCTQGLNSLEHNISYKKELFEKYFKGVISKQLQNMLQRQGLSQDFKNACPKQQFQNFCPSRFSYLSTSNPYTSYI